MGRARALLPLLAAASVTAAVTAAAEQGYTVISEASAVHIHVGKTGIDTSRPTVYRRARGRGAASCRAARLGHGLE